MAIKTKHGMPQQKGNFKLVGQMTGTRKEDFFKAKEQKNGAERNTTKFGLQTSLENEIYVEVGDSEKDYAYFFRRSDDKAGITKDTAKVPWNRRNDFEKWATENNIDPEGYNLIGADIRIEKEKNEKGKLVNKKVLKTDFDACEYLNKLVTEGHLKDSAELRVMGDLEFSSFDGKDGKVRFKRFKAKKIYNSAVDFIDDGFVEEADFKQSFIFMGIESKKIDGEDVFLVKGKVAGYSTFEDVEFIIRNKKLAMSFRKNLKPYTAILVFGNINNKRMEEVVTKVDDDWGGESNPFDFIKNPRKFELEIRGIDPSTIDKTTYTEEKITKALKVDDDFGDAIQDDDDWGSDKVAGGDDWNDLD